MGILSLVWWPWKESSVSIGSSDVIPSPIDSDYECVRRDSQDPMGKVAEPPTPQLREAASPELCPEGYVPRHRRREYRLEGKVVQTGRPPERNPDAP
jgi:hypothetical protein